MARMSRILLIACFIVIMLFKGGKEVMGEGAVMDGDAILMGDATAVKCCHDNHIGRCIPGKDDSHCDKICHQHCPKGGRCKILGKKPPNHFCHCYC